MSPEHNTTHKPANDKGTALAASRRKFITRAAIGSLPVIFSLNSRSAWATGMNCSTTGIMSGNQSVQGVCSQGERILSSHGFWKNHYPTYPVMHRRRGTPSGVIRDSLNNLDVNEDKSTLFVDVFKVNTFPGKSLQWVLRRGPDSLSRNIVAVYLDTLYEQVYSANAEQIGTPAMNIGLTTKNIVQSYQIAMGDVSGSEANQLAATLEYLIDGV
ncbi:hypothetical protein [Flocculibacter collagenilyticus]|uniref:hypothetical protein n=1 Tax=Flocculibacter collagenilyticus TaxID=2744479 RepID=UPI0018F7301D|nr:hypothetical protein [Flocculibacter collagenilyticus]